jgi:hypothetical protein
LSHSYRQTVQTEPHIAVRAICREDVGRFLKCSSLAAVAAYFLKFLNIHFIQLPAMLDKSEYLVYAF